MVAKPLTNTSLHTLHPATASPNRTEGQKEQASLWKACERFEAFLVAYLLQQMWRTAEALGGEKNFVSQTYRELFTLELAEELAQHLPLGIAETLYRSLSDSVPVKAKSAIVDAPEHGGEP